MRFIHLLCLLSTLMAGLVSAQDNCECSVINSVSVSQASGTCNLAGQGQVACFQFAVGSVPGGSTPSPGRCPYKVGEVWVCTNSSCSYSTLRAVVTAAACFTDCGARSPSKPTYEPAVNAPTDVPDLSAGGTANYDILSVGADATCGSRLKDVFVRFHNKQGAVIFEMRGRFQCLQCQALTDG